MSKKSSIFLIVLVIFLLIIILLSKGGLKKDGPSDSYSKNEKELTPEEVIMGMDDEINLEEVTPVVKIISPEGDKIMTGQARSFKAEVSFPKTNANYCACNWKFYLNRYDEEELWREQETNCADNFCHFTGIVDDSGELRLSVDLLEKSYTNKEIQILSNDERGYTVSR